MAEDTSNRTDDPPSADPVVAAIETVLAAERAAEASLADCRRQAQASVAAAREQADAIGRRADARISRVHTAYLQKIDTHAATLRQSADPPADNADGGEQASHYAEAARRLAAKLTSDCGETTR